MPETKLWWTSSSGALNLQLTLSQARGASHQGQCSDDVRALSQEPDIAAQLCALDPVALARELKDYGAWSAEDLADHAQNLQRVLWIAAGDILENPPADWPDCDCCGSCHPAGYTGDCRDDSNRWP